MIYNFNSNYFKITLIFLTVIFLFSVCGSFMNSQISIIPISLHADTPEQQITIVLDPGHGGEDGGACSYGGLFEKDLNLLISKDIYNMLFSYGINVIMTRYDDRLLYDPDSDYVGHKKSQDLANRLKIANEIPGAILISIHMNAFPEEKYRGLQVYYSLNSDKSHNLALNIQSNTKQLLDSTNKRKIKPAGSNIYLLNRTKNTGVLIECGFLSNAEERNLLNTIEYRKKLSFIISCSIIQYIEQWEI